jgi:hypothetical protein
MNTPPERSHPLHKIFTSAEYSFIHKPLDSDTLSSYGEGIFSPTRLERSKHLRRFKDSNYSSSHLC